VLAPLFSSAELDAIEEIIETEKQRDRNHGQLAHGDFDVTPIFQQDGAYTGLIDFGEIRGAEPFHDLGHFHLHDGEALPLDVCYVLRDGSDVTLVTWGAQVKETLEAADKLAEQGISAEVIDVATLRPLDFATIAESVAKTGRCVIVHEAPRTAGFGAEIAARLAEESMYDLLAPVARVTGYDTHIPLFRLEMKYLPSVERIVAAARRAVAG
jgi:aminoglycoside phosphotransferase (APT) family kinase protein